MSPRVKRAVPPFVQIAEHFRKKILEGNLLEGQKLPSVVEIAREWEVATATAAKALGQLRDEGYVRSSTQGTFVSISKKQTTGSDRLRMLRVTGSGYRPGERAEVLSAALEPAPSDVAQALGIEEGT